MIDKKRGRLTLPSEANFYDETIEMLEKLGADAIRDSDGTYLPEDIKDIEGVDIYTNFFPSRGHNDFAETVPFERSRYFLISDFITATEDTTEISFLKGYYPEQIIADYDYEPKDWWEVYDRTLGEVVSRDDWEVDKEKNIVSVKTIPYHVYTVNFLAYGIWDPVQMYNHITNDWGDEVAHHIPFDVRYEKSSKFVEENLENWLKENPKTDVVRFTTFFYQFSLIFNEDAKEKYVDWFGYSNSVSPEAILEFEKEYGYRLTSEDFIDQGFYNSNYRIPSKRYLDYIDFQQKYVSSKAKRLVDLVHKYNKKAIMFLGDHWIGTEPYGKYFKNIGLDGVVGSVGDGATLRIISDIDVPMTEGRFLPYFFPDEFYEGNDPSIEAKDNWVKARRALLRSPLDRIGYGGYLSLAYKFPKFIDYITKVADEFREIHDISSKATAYKSCKVAILNSWGKIRTWGAYVVAHGKWFKLGYSYSGMMEALSGMDMEVTFINFDDVKAGIDEDIDVIINAGDAYTAFSGGDSFLDPEVLTNLRKFVYEGGGFIGIGDPTAYQHQGRFFQLADVMGVDVEKGFSQGYDRYFTSEIEDHFITKDLKDYVYGEERPNVYATSDKTQILKYANNEVQMAANEYGKGRSFYAMGLAYSLENTRLLKRAIHYVAHNEDDLEKYFAKDLRLEVAAYPDLNKYCVINNSTDDVKSIVYDGKGNSHEVEIEAGDLIWFEE